MSATTFLRRTGRAASVVALATAAILLGCGRSEKQAGPAAPLDPGQVLYSQGKYAEALPLLEKSLDSDRSGTRLYQTGFCKGAVEGQAGTSKQKLWDEAAPLLEKEIAAPGGATLDRLYYLTSISYTKKDLDATRKYARQAVDQIEKGPDPNALTGEDWFRLARLHEFLQEGSESEAAYRRAISFFNKTPALNPSYQALTVARIADLDFDGLRYDLASVGYDAALKLVPGLDQVKPFRYGVSLLAVGRLDEAIAEFAKDRDPDSQTESQYAGDLARKAKEAGGLVSADSDGVTIAGMAIDGLEERIRKSGKAFRAAREKNSYKPGDPLTAELADAQKHFASLLRERLLQTRELQEFCLKEGLADLVRR
jgi:tetratricopeptide (TPR) repeat protein